jgi:hypothetical protein
MATHYCACSWTTTLVDVWFPQHHTVCLIQETLGTKGLALTVVK